MTDTVHTPAPIPDRFTGNFTQQEPMPQASIDAAMAVLQHGRLHRYNVIEGEVAEAALLEQEFADFTGAKYCLGVASGGYAIAVALKASGVRIGDKVMTNAFTLAPVPGAIENVGAKSVLVEVTDGLTLDLNDLEAKIIASGARTLLLSHMRGHIVDMDALMEICNANDVTVIEDCAHTMGAHWNGTPSGRHGLVGCYSTQTFKHINSGEGGLFVTDDAEVMARATMMSGSYMLFERHLAGAPAETFDDIKLDTPNCSGRMDNLRAAILRPQLADLAAQCDRWNVLYHRMDAGLANTPGLQIIERDAKEQFVASAHQFLLPNFSSENIQALMKRCAARGVELKWFGADGPTGFTSRHDSWRYMEAQSLPQTDRILAGLIDMRLPLTFSVEDCDVIAAIIRQEVGVIHQGG
jgi:dTDP-4-amino-4,6-dideoxygalactose transaminase